MSPKNPFQNIHTTEEALGAYPDLETVQGSFSLKEIVTALWHKERQRVYHKNQSLERQAIFERLRKEHPELWEAYKK